MTNWAYTVSELATGVGTLVLAVATFAAVRSANRSARLAEESMRASMRPVLMHSRLGDTAQKFAFGDGKWVGVAGGGAVVEATENAVYLAISVRNTGTGMAILHGWRACPGRSATLDEHPPLEWFTAQTRDMYVAPDDVGFWQGALRDPQQEVFGSVTAAVTEQGQVYVDLLYGDFEGGQRVISRFNLVYRDSDQAGHLSQPGPAGHLSQPGQPRRPSQPDPAGQAGHPAPAPAPGPGQPPGPQPQGRWLASVVRHWNVDRPDPR